MKTKIKSLIALSLFIMLTFSLSVVALAGTLNGDDNLHSNNEDSLVPDGIGLLVIFNVVTTTDAPDTSLGDGICVTALLPGNPCTLRAAIEQANALAGPDIIDVPPGTYLLTHGNGDLDITSTLTISGAGVDATIIENNVERTFDINPTGVATITNVTIRSSEDSGNGGGIRNEGTLLLIKSKVSENITGVNGGGIFNDGTGSRIGDLIVIDTLITTNVAGDAGGGIFNRNGTVIISNSTVSLNGAEGGPDFGVGGGIANSAENSNATMTIIQSRITTNTVSGVGGGGISNSADFNQTATVILSKTLVSGNVATVTTTNVISTTGFGGGIRNSFFTTANANSSAILIVNNSTVSGNSAFNGGGIANGTLTAKQTLHVDLRNSTVSTNTATHKASNNDAVGNGGGLLNQDGTMAVVNSTISGNTADGGSGQISGLGGGLVNTGIGSAATLWLTNTTITGNSAMVGPGIANADNPFFSVGTTTNLKNNIIGNGCANLVPTGVLNSNGYNLEQGSATTCGLTATGDFTTTNLALGPLKKQQPGDDTETHALLEGSPAIDSGICSGAPPKDQREQNRPNAISAFCDVGALESSFLGVADLEITKVVTPTQADPGQAITYTLTFINNGPAWAGNVVIDDVVPPTVTDLASANSGVAITATGGVSYSWTLGDLARGGAGTITITGLISPGVLSGNSFINTALITNLNDSDNDSATVAIGDIGTTIYLPLIVKN